MTANDAVISPLIGLFLKVTLVKTKPTLAVVLKICRRNWTGATFSKDTQNYSIHPQIKGHREWRCLIGNFEAIHPIALQYCRIL